MSPVTTTPSAAAATTVCASAATSAGVTKSRWRSVSHASRTRRRDHARSDGASGARPRGAGTMVRCARQAPRPRSAWRSPPRSARAAAQMPGQPTPRSTRRSTVARPTPPPARPTCSRSARRAWIATRRPNRAGALPLVMYTFVEAEAWCAARDRRLCFDDEWLAACAGSDGLAYPYGATRVPRHVQRRRDLARVHPVAVERLAGRGVEPDDRLARRAVRGGASRVADRGRGRRPRRRAVPGQRWAARALAASAPTGVYDLGRRRRGVDPAPRRWPAAVPRQPQGSLLGRGADLPEQRAGPRRHFPLLRDRVPLLPRSPGPHVRTRRRSAASPASSGRRPRRAPRSR
jgi:hypothetical protein